MVPFIPLLLCFPHLLLPKSPRALPFLAFASALKYPIINPEQSQAALPRYPMCHTISHTPGQQPPFSPKMNQIAAPGDSRGDGLHSWMLGLKLSWDGPGRDLDRVSIPQGSVIWVPLLPLCPCAPLGLGRWACGGPVAHGWAWELLVQVIGLLLPSLFLCLLCVRRWASCHLTYHRPLGFVSYFHLRMQVNITVFSFPYVTELSEELF